jgi:2-oxo-4-hydroxy-4-carboxy-5-ureidoimidazoline decarboxylase
MSCVLTDLNQMDQTAFVATIGFVFERTPTISEQVWHQRPFASVADLHQKMAALVQAMPRADQLALIQAHPDLGTRAAMAEASVKEQTGAGLTQLNAEDYHYLLQLNQRYRERFGFPFIIAVRNHTKDTIITTLEQCLDNSVDSEILRALAEIIEIGRFRLTDLVLE